jgi:phospholipid/cholesterol/gamma-HCH transport system substrate-binding protein
METRANYVVVGVFVLLIIAGAFASVLWLAGEQLAQRAPAYYDIYFSGSVVGLDKGAKVRLNGIPIGEVSEIRLDPDNPEQVRVTVSVDSTSPIKQDSVAALETESFLTGVAYVEISGGSRDAPLLERTESNRYAVIPSKPSTLQTTFQSAPELLKKLGTVADRVSDVLNDQNRARVADTLKNTDELMASLNKDSQKIDKLLDDVDVAAKQLDTTLVTANGAIEDAQQTLHNIDNLAADFSTTAKQFNVTAQHLDAMLQENRPGIRDFTQGGLMDLHRLILDARVLVQGLTRVADELERDPSRFIWGDRRTGYQPK